jgi:SAM-dependent methyltransferase
VAELWRCAPQRTAQFDAQALDYDRYRPRYPQACFDDLVETAGLWPGDEAVEVGAGTGIATVPLVEAGLRVTAIEPGANMAAIAKAKLAGRAVFFDGRFEEWSPPAPVPLVVAFNAWHWVEPSRGVELAATALVPGGTIALAWTEVVSWGAGPFARLLCETTGEQWPTGPFAEAMASLELLRADPRFGPVEVHRHRFERALDAATFVAVTRTYGGGHDPGTYRAIARAIDEDLGGSVTKVEEVTIYLARRCQPRACGDNAHFGARRARRQSGRAEEPSLSVVTLGAPSRRVSPRRPGPAPGSTG